MTSSSGKISHRYPIFLKNTKHIKSSELISFLKANYIELSSSKDFVIKSPTQGYMNQVLVIESEGAKYTAIFYNANRYSSKKEKQDLDEKYKFAEYLDENGLPSRVPTYSKDDKHILKYTFNNGDQNLFGLYKYLEGETIPWEAYTRRHLYALGELTKKLHDLGSKYLEQGNNLEVWDEYLKDDSTKMFDYFNAHEVVIIEKLGIEINFEFENLKLESSNDEQESLLHMDIVRGNVLFSDTKEELRYPITGLLDFEKTLIGPTVVELARSLAFLLVDCAYKDEGEIIFYFLKQAYGINNVKEYWETSNIRDYLIYFLLRDLWKFLTANPYRSLGVNFHYQRTVEYLIHFNAIKRSEVLTNS